MRVVLVRHVRMRMPSRCVPMRVAVRADWRRIVKVRVMAVIVGMGMLVLFIVVRVFVPWLSAR